MPGLFTLELNAAAVRPVSIIRHPFANRPQYNCRCPCHGQNKSDREKHHGTKEQDTQRKSENPDLNGFSGPA